ncbi:MAG: cytochrome P450 [Phormidesmis sp.]
MTTSQISKCPFHAAQQIFQKKHYIDSNRTSPDAQTAKAKPIPHSKTPKILQAAKWALDPVGYIQKNVKRHGDVFRAPVSSKKSYCLVSDPKILQYLFTHDTGTALSSPGELTQITVPLIGRKNVIGSGGKQHQHRRKVTMPPLRPQNCLKTYSTIIQQVTQEVIDQWQVGDSFDLRVEMQKITTRVILRVVLGLESGDRALALENLLSSLLNMIATPVSSLLLFVPWLRTDLGPWSPGGRMRMLRNQIENRLLAEVKERRNETHRNTDQASAEMDVLSLLLSAKDHEGSDLSDQDICDELIMFLITGFEATTIALTWNLYWAHFLPEVKHNVLTELNALPEEHDASQLMSLPYLSAVCNETLRIHSVVMLTFARRVNEPLQLGGYQFKPGDLVMGSTYSLHRREDLYPQPDRFRPKRFIERKFSPYEFMPFGGGVRRCMGSALAQSEMKIVLATVLRQVDLSLVNHHPIKQIRRGIASGPKSPIRVTVMKKDNKAASL